MWCETRLEDYCNGWLALADGSAAQQTWYAGVYPDKTLTMGVYFSVEVGTDSALGQQILQQVYEITKLQEKHVDERIQSVLTAMEQRSQTDYQALEKRIDHSQQSAAEQHKSLEAYYDKALKTEHDHFAKLYSSHALSTNQLVTDLEHRTSDRHRQHFDELKDMQSSAEHLQQKKIADIEKLCIESAAVLKTQQECGMTQLRDKLQEMIGHIENNMWYYVVDVLKAIFANQMQLRPKDANEIKDKMFNCFLRSKVRAIENKCDHALYRVQKEAKEMKYGRERRRSRSRARPGDKIGDRKEKQHTRYYDKKEQKHR